MTVPDKDISDIQAFYNDIAEEFAADWYANDSLLPVLKRFIALLPPSPKVLDLGCGAGYESMRLKRLGAEVTGVDFSEKPLKIARERNPDIRFEIMDFRQLSPDLGLFDGIAAVASLIHIPGGELALVFSRMSAVLNSGGYILIIVVEGQGLSRERSFIEKGGKRYNRAFYLNDRAALSASAQPAGLAFYCEFDLPETLSSYGWKCFVYKKTD